MGYFSVLPTVPLLAGLSRVPLYHGNVPLFVRSRIFLRACNPIERNYGNSVRFLAKIPNGRPRPRPTAAESPCYSVFWNAIDFCKLYRGLLLKQISMRALPTVTIFAGKSRLFTRNVPLKTFSRLAGLTSVYILIQCNGTEAEKATFLAVL